MVKRSTIAQGSTQRRFVINFGEMSEEEARQWSGAYEDCRDEGEAIRDTRKRDVYRTKWWQFGEKQTALYLRAASLRRLLAICRVSQSCAFSFVEKGAVYADSLVVICKDTYAAFATLQSRPHELWARFFASSMKDDIRYTPSDCFETFPFPAGVLEHAAGDSPTTNNRQLDTLESTGREYYEFRAALMVRNNEGLTKTYNRFHDPDETSPDILKLRELHAAMDRAVLDAYGWTDLKPTCEFLLDYEEEEDEDDERVTQRPRQEKALALPLARRLPRRSPRPPAGTEQEACRRGTAHRARGRNRNE